ncbi:hypothetical protein TNIN_372081 [Trichonephila inaurata madagascariensis]|uniref:Uncharacterized protein n=1 Tax=Trichonephila inaurata madagascariensis TaxID=2747483 RepID=A0A8X6Y833_9ARAC|nr:hypothetical protein TNIN_372081 [Trichonephila inaurata madagascariensis]
MLNSTTRYPKPSSSDARMDTNYRDGLSFSAWTADDGQAPSRHVTLSKKANISPCTSLRREHRTKNKVGSLTSKIDNLAAIRGFILNHLPS